MTLHSPELQSIIYKLIEYELGEAFEAICSNLFHFQMKSRVFKRHASKFLQKAQCKDTLVLMSLHPNSHSIPSFCLTLRRRGNACNFQTIKQYKITSV